MGIFDRVTSLASTEWAQASNLAHATFQSRIGVHRHTGRALIETAAEVCRNHPNLVGIAAGFMVERLLVEERHRHDAYVAAQAKRGRAVAAQTPQPAIDAAPPVMPVQTAHLKLMRLKPRKIAWEVFGALILLKLASSGARFFRHKNQNEVWFAPAARIRLFSGSIAAYQLAKALRSPKVSAWRNAVVLFFGTRALKPLLNPSKKAMAAAAAAATASAAATNTAVTQAAPIAQPPVAPAAAPVAVPFDPVPVVPSVETPSGLVH